MKNRTIIVPCGRMHPTVAVSWHLCMTCRLPAEEGLAKICDVGMVRHQLSDLMTPQPMMTPLWAAPEVMKREKSNVKVRPGE